MTATVATWVEVMASNPEAEARPGLSREARDEIAQIHRIRNGAPDEFAEVVRRHQSRVFAILSRYERDTQLVEDLAQDTFVKAWKALAQFDGRAPFEHWLSRIAAHVAIDHIRARRDREVRFTDLGDEALNWLQDVDSGRSPNPAAAREILDLAMQKLGAEDRLVITLLEIEEYSVKEICERTGWTSVVTRVRAFRARAKLRRALEEIEQTARPDQP